LWPGGRPAHLGCAFAYRDLYWLTEHGNPRRKYCNIGKLCFRQYSALPELSDIRFWKQVVPSLPSIHSKRLHRNRRSSWCVRFCDKATSYVAKASTSLPFLQSFTSSMSCGGVAPRSIVWAANGPMLYAQLALRSRRAQEASSAAKPTATSASATEDAAIPCQTLTEQYRLIRADCLQPCDL
jgi:hypothetical protein